MDNTKPVGANPRNGIPSKPRLCPGKNLSTGIERVSTSVPPCPSTPWELPCQPRMHNPKNMLRPPQHPNPILEAPDSPSKDRIQSILCTSSHPLWEQFITKKQKPNPANIHRREGESGALPYHVTASRMHSLRHLTHEPNAPSAIHQIHFPAHLHTHTHTHTHTSPN
jgi:hypothetical protein